MQRRFVAGLVVAAAAVAGALLVTWLSRVPGVELGGSKSLSVPGLMMNVPASWNINATGWPSTGLGGTWAFVGNVPWGVCLPGDINCHYERRLSGGQIEVEIGMVGMLMDFCEVGATRSDLAGRGPNDPAATGRLMRIDGRPTLQTDYAVGRQDYYRSDEWRDWRIAMDGTLASAFSIHAKYQGPDVAVFRSQLDAMIASARIVEDPTKVRGNEPNDCGAPFPP